MSAATLYYDRESARKERTLHRAADRARKAEMNWRFSA